MENVLPNVKNLRIQTYPNPCLTKVCEPVENIDENILAYIDRLKTLLSSTTHGIGLAASQAGLLLRIYVAYEDLNSTGRGEIKAYINPKFTPNKNSDIISEDEGCLSFPGVNGRVSRRYSGTLTYINENGEKVSEVVEGLKARCAMHEIDHLNGISIHHSMDEEDKPKNRMVLNKLAGSKSLNRSKSRFKKRK